MILQYPVVAILKDTVMWRGDPCLLPASGRVGFGEPTLDRYLEFVASRARLNTAM